MPASHKGGHSYAPAQAVGADRSLVHAPSGPGLGARIDFDLIERRKVGVLR